MKLNNLITLILCFFILSTNCYGETKKLRAAHTNWFPYTYQENETSLGFEIEIFKEIMNIMNIQVEIAEYPWQRCLYLLKKGDADVLISMLKTPEREKFAYYPDEHISLSKTVFFTTADKNIVFTGNYESLKEYTIGVIAGFSYGDAFDKADYLKTDNSKDAQMLIRKLLGGRNDIAAENQAVVISNALKMGVENKIKFLETPIHFQNLYVGFSKASTQESLCEDFSKHLKEFKNTELYKSILEKYGIKISDMGN
ncbi:Extracellular solute-binding protein, family 3 [Desulfonema limicola]|uniref:Extracellular solute-binding protein, family 3 n=1 Tax=Desulfonema limicola TaxID=45656 RepID=A0A975GGF7_9BACT|nr:transporter substrate-binding domain-containing protein [Desulfonema limicola]QTA80203.1 Extracellular solute-binding protein, family 3 [Desulfonema limicola]